MRGPAQKAEVGNAVQFGESGGQVQCRTGELLAIIAECGGRKIKFPGDMGLRPNLWEIARTAAMAYAGPITSPVVRSDYGLPMGRENASVFYR